MSHIILYSSENAKTRLDLRVEGETGCHYHLANTIVFKRN